MCQLCSVLSVVVLDVVEASWMWVGCGGGELDVGWMWWRTSVERYPLCPSVNRDCTRLSEAQ